MSNKHTPGPWRKSIPVGHGKASTILDSSREQYRLADVYWTPSGDGEANARLIAAAPELLEALQAIDSKARLRAAQVGGKCVEYIVDREWIDAARAAIAKVQS